MKQSINDTIVGTLHINLFDWNTVDWPLNVFYLDNIAGYAACVCGSTRGIPKLG